MKATDFCYWLQGYFEIGCHDPDGLNEEQVETIKRHLAMVFIHDIDPSYPASQQDALNEAHSGPKPVKPTLGGVSSDGAIMRC